MALPAITSLGRRAIHAVPRTGMEAALAVDDGKFIAHNMALPLPTNTPSQALAIIKSNTWRHRWIRTDADSTRQHADLSEAGHVHFAADACTLRIHDVTSHIDRLGDTDTLLGVSTTHAALRHLPTHGRRWFAKVLTSVFATDDVMEAVAKSATTEAELCAFAQLVDRIESDSRRAIIHAGGGDTQRRIYDEFTPAGAIAADVMATLGGIASGYPRCGAPPRQPQPPHRLRAAAEDDLDADARGTAAAHKDLVHAMRASFPARFAKEWAGFVRAWENDAALLSGRLSIADPVVTEAKVLQHRYRNSAIGVMALFAELAALALPPQPGTQSRRHYDDALRHAGLAICIVNDIVSYEKEAAAGLAGTSVVQYHVVRGSSVDGAMEAAVHRANENVACARASLDSMAATWPSPRTDYMVEHLTNVVARLCDGGILWHVHIAEQPNSRYTPGLVTIDWGQRVGARHTLKVQDGAIL